MTSSGEVRGRTSPGDGCGARGRLAVCAVVLGLVVILQGCGDFTGACTRELVGNVSPQDTTIAVGRSFVPVVRLTSCGGREQVMDEFSFVPDDPAVARVDPDADRVTAAGTGQTHVRVIGEQHGRLGAIRVTVVP